MTRFITQNLLLTGGLAGLSLATSHAALTVGFTGQYETGTGPFTPSYGAAVSSLNNVLAGLAPSLATGDFQKEGAAGTPILTNGSIGPIGAPTGLGIFATVGNGLDGSGAGTLLNYHLAAPTTLAGIAIYGGWLDGGRDEQDFQVRYSIDGVNFINLVRVENKGTAGLTITTPVAVRSFISDDSGSLAGGALITDLQFDFKFPSGVENGYTGLSEIAAYAAVPEPASCALLGLGGILGLLRRRR